MPYNTSSVWGSGRESQVPVSHSIMRATTYSTEMVLVSYGVDILSTLNEFFFLTIFSASIGFIRKLLYCKLRSSLQEVPSLLPT
jgi:hypothetical protein